MKRLYNWYCRFYGGVEKQLGPNVDEILAKNIANIPGIKEKSVLEYACGTGMVTFRLAKFFRTVRARDASAGMLGYAKERAEKEGFNIDFQEGNILELAEGPNSYDYVFVSLALHLFSPETEIQILKGLLKIAREAVIILDHGKRWRLKAAITEWFEGGYYDQFIKTDFAALAGKVGAQKFIEKQLSFESFDFSYLVFYK
jgi:ubiquinone/menaquinone biosynthesis C-methylase UbiE